MLGLEADVDRATIERVADVLAGTLGWDAGRRRQEVDAFRAAAERARPGRPAEPPKLVALPTP
jgi:hypothetical protein